MMKIFENLSFVQLFILVKDEEIVGHASNKISQMRKFFLSLTILIDCNMEMVQNLWRAEAWSDI